MLSPRMVQVVSVHLARIVLLLELDVLPLWKGGGGPVLLVHVVVGHGSVHKPRILPCVNIPDLLTESNMPFVRETDQQ